MEWIFSPVTVRQGDRTYRGLGWKVRLSGLEEAMWLRITEPAAMRFGDWMFAQVWGDFIERHLGYGTPLAVPLHSYFGDGQPFFFTGGPGGAVVSAFGKPVAAQAAVTEEAGRLLTTLRIPLSTGAVRETPVRYWLYSGAELPTKWAVLNEWTAVYDAVAGYYRRLLGLGVTEPRPTLINLWPGDAYYESYRHTGTPNSWLTDVADAQLPLAASLGFRALIIQAPFECDAQYLPGRYLPGSRCWGSAQAPWRLDISEAGGGGDALRDLCDRAHALGVKIVLWAPTSLSNSSPLLTAHPEWTMWRINGIPEDFDWGDVTGTSYRSGYYDYALSEYRKIRRRASFDGLWLDSFLTFGIFPDYRDRQPYPQLDRTLALQGELRRMGVTEIYLEGCGPLGLSTGGFGHEPPVPADLDRIRGREYGLYRYIADVAVEPESYYRALASKGVIGPYDLGVLAALPDNQRGLIAQANRDYMRVLDRMEQRRLIGRGDAWEGVAWTRRGAKETVFFSFGRFRYRLARKVTIEDITAGVTTEAAGSFETAPLHTYIIGDGVDLLTSPVNGEFGVGLQNTHPKIRVLRLGRPARSAALREE